ncbi:MAG: DAK2 domain-containing protein [Oscillospiraceae bacterium]|nr:DAK2 domain-containing protein [Oscillospiraceae bacterium]
MTECIDGVQFRRMVVHAAAAIQLEKQGINELNVFPVPDGDTGTNMSLTIAAAAAELEKKSPAAIGAAAGVSASALLRAARGNSGVILSLLFRGFSKHLKEMETARAADVAAALAEGVSAAYNAVMKPAEGTILTVSRLAARRAAEAAAERDDVEYTLQAAIEEGWLALADTVNQNPVLKKAGVVDAGGKGFLIILQGMLDSLRGLPVPEVEDAGQEKADFASLGGEDITFTYDTVFTVRKTAPCSLEPLRGYLNSIGDSLVIGEDDGAFKVHVHTDTPGAALTEAQKYGQLELAKIENMRTQYENLAAGRKTHSADELDMEPEAAPPKEEAAWKPYGFVAVCAGEGLTAVFRDLGCDRIISGGQTMNPSTQDILGQIQQTPAKTVYVLPNNSNIILAAQQCVGLASGKKVVVLPTKTVPQGVAAMLAVDLDAGEEENTRAMEAALAQVHTSEVTRAARDSGFDGEAIREGDYMVLCEHHLFAAGADLTQLLRRLAQAQPQQDAEFITIFYGENVPQDEAQATLELFQDACPEAEITLLSGGQPVYLYMISAE